MATPSLEHVLDEARTSWLCNTTRGDPQWKVKQLHGLHELLITNRDEIVSTIVQECSISTTLVEHQLALLVEDLSAHIFNDERKSKPQNGQTIWGKTSLEHQPYGVSLILTGSSDPLCDPIAPLASSIAAGNVVVLGSFGSKNNSLFSILQRELAKYLESFSIHILADIDLEQINTGDAHQITIFDDSPQKYSTLLADPKAKFCLTEAGYNLAIVDAGKVDQEKLIQEILQCSKPKELPSRTLSAVFVREEIAQDIYALLCKKIGACLDSQYTKDSEIARVYLGDPKKSKRGISLSETLETAYGTEIPAVVICTSLDQALDSIEKLKDKVAQITIISPASKKHVDYMKNWTSAPVVLLGHIQALYPTVIRESSTLPKGAKPCMYPTTMFSRPQITISDAKARPSESISSIRDSYEGTVPAYKAEPRGERVGFFDQVFYVVQGAAAVVGILGIVGLWYGGKAARGYFKG